MRFNRLFLRLSSLTIIIGVLTGCQPAAAPPTVTPRTDYRVGLVTDALGGTIHDGTFNEATYNGLTRSAGSFGLDVAYSESRDPIDYAPAIQKFIDEGRNIIVTVSFDMVDVTSKFAQKYPKVYFIGIDQSLDNLPANYIAIQFREDEGGFLVGALAGMMTKSNVVGVVGGVKIPAVVRFVNGFVNGVHYTNPTAAALSVYTSAFDNVDEGRQQAQNMLDQKADVIFGAGGLTGSSAILRASEAGVYVIGVDQDEYRTTFGSGKNNPNAALILTSAVKRVDAGVYNIINDLLKGNFKSGGRTFGASECGITYAPFHDADSKITVDMKTKLDRMWSALAAGSLQTGAQTDPPATIAPLAAGQMPPVPDNAPQMSKCG